MHGAAKDEEATMSAPEDDGLKRKPTAAANLRAYFGANISTNHADLLMLSCCFISGLVDSTIYNAYGTFVSMQTGPQQRRTLGMSYLLQSLIMLFVAALAQGGVVNGLLSTVPDDVDWLQEIPVALLSFQAAGQLAGSRALNLHEIPTVVVTSLIYDFGSDPALLQSWSRNVKRNRRGLAFLGILAGAIVGGWIDRRTERMESALWLAAGIKVVITISLIFWPEAQGTK
ncbi:MAG: hypothetical protein Q9201_005864 [Fulgogasparrea decipioides]